jgi:hypothetical protein
MWHLSGRHTAYDKLIAEGVLAPEDISCLEQLCQAHSWGEYMDALRRLFVQRRTTAPPAVSESQRDAVYQKLRQCYVLSALDVKIVNALVRPADASDLEAVLHTVFKPYGALKPEERGAVLDRMVTERRVAECDAMNVRALWYPKNATDLEGNIRHLFATTSSSRQHILNQLLTDGKLTQCQVDAIKTLLHAPDAAFSQCVLNVFKPRRSLALDKRLGAILVRLEDEGILHHDEEHTAELLRYLVGNAEIELCDDNDIYMKLNSLLFQFLRAPRPGATATPSTKSTSERPTAEWIRAQQEQAILAPGGPLDQLLDQVKAQAVAARPYAMISLRATGLAIKSAEHWLFQVLQRELKALGFARVTYHPVVNGTATAGSVHHTWECIKQAAGKDDDDDELFKCITPKYCYHSYVLIHWDAHEEEATTK